MFNLIKELRNNDYSDELFVVGGISETKVEELARKLNVTFTNSYKEFLMEFGRIIGYGVDILGCGQSGEASVVKETLRYRQFGLPNQFVVIRDIGEWVYCLDTTNDGVISWDRNSQTPKKVCNSFEEYICDTILEAKEDWDDEE